LFHFAISELHFTFSTELTLAQLDIPSSILTHSASALGYYIYSLNSSMRLGGAMAMSFTVDWFTSSLVNNSPTTSLLNSGSFFTNAEAFPLLGYQSGAQLLDNNRRRKYDRPPAEHMAKIDGHSQ
jgi:ABC-2 type transport system permease protein